MLTQILPPFSFTVRLDVTVAEGEANCLYRCILHQFIGWVRSSIDPACYGLVLRPFRRRMLNQILPPFLFTVRLSVTVAEGEEDGLYRCILHGFIGWVRSSIDPACHGLVLMLILLATT